ncbi:MAG TPA: hypothetical protein VJK07_02435 [Candidatus Nanoarchaeia archaeon]|nr:hypothetical protein [Candidatus Nanoarchaeia archaeon]
MELVAFLGADKEGWGQVSALINHGTWDKIILIKNARATDYPTPEYADEIVVDSTLPLFELRNSMIEKLKGKFSEFEAHLSLASGTGKEHMAVIAAILSIPMGIRLVAFTKKGVETLN